MGKIRLVVFDLDGTLLDTLNDIRNAINYALRCSGLKECTREEVRRYVGSGLKNALRRAIEEKNECCVDEAEFAIMLTLLRRYYESNAATTTRAYPGIEDILFTLTSRGIEVAVLTNKDERLARALCDAFFADVRFSFVDGKRENRALKPDKALTLSLLNERGIRSAEALFVGDSEVDYQTAENAGSESIIVSYGFRTADELKKSGVKSTVKDTKELKMRLEELVFARHM